MKERVEWFKGVETIVSEPLNFKAKLAIGEEAYASLKVKNAVIQAWDVAGVATTAAVVAKSSVVASTFFAPTGVLAVIGLGTAVTPIGWVVAAGVVTGGAWLGITRHFKKNVASKITVVPNFINTPLDVLALGLFDLLAPLALKVANGTQERKLINSYFVKEWGYEPTFVDEGLRYVEASLDDLSIKQLAQIIADFTRQNPDCNFRMMSQEILQFLRNIVATDGKLKQQDEKAIEDIEAIFKSANKRLFKERIQRGWFSFHRLVGKVFALRKSK